MNQSSPDFQRSGRDEGCVFLPMEKLVDYAMGNLPPAESRHIAVHLEGCSSCRYTVQEWAELLEPSSAEKVENEVSVPRKSLRRRLMLHAALRFAPRTAVRRNKRLMAGIGAACAVMLVIGFSLFNLKAGVVSPEASVDRMVHDRMSVLQKRADTEKYLIEPVSLMSGGGSVWIRRESGEMLIIVDGLRSLARQEYLVWLETDGQLRRAGQLQPDELRGRSYYYGFGKENVRKIVVSLEPKNSARIPSKPEAVLVDMILPGQ